MILISGGTGFVGSHLIPRLATSDERIRCLVRSLANTETLQEHGAQLALGDVTDPQSLSAAIQGVDTVIHLVAIIREHKGVNFSGINDKGTRNMVEAAKSCGVKRFIHISALGASSNPRYRYTHSKWQGEEEVRSSNLEFVIFRPSVIFGQGFGYSFIDSMIRSLRMFPFIAPVPGPGKTRFQPIWVEDVVSCIIQTLKNEKGSQTYEIGGPEHLSYEEMLDTVIHAMSMRRVKLHIPIPLMRLAVMAMERTMRNPPVTSVELAQLELDNITDLDSVECRFGFKPLALDQGLDYIKPS